VPRAACAQVVNHGLQAWCAAAHQEQRVATLRPIAALEALRTELGLQVPRDVSVVGFDNVPQAAWPSFNLTTVQQSVDQMVDATRTLLFDQIGGQVMARTVDVPCVLVERGTVLARRAMPPTAPAA